MRFYVSIQAPSGLLFKLELIDAGRVTKYDQEFPSLAKIIRYEVLREAERHALSRIQRGLFGSSREKYLNNVIWPETTNQLTDLLNKQQLRMQLSHALKEQQYRQTSLHQSSATPPPHTCFTDMPSESTTPSQPSLNQWIHAAHEKLDTTNRSSHVALPAEPMVSLTFNPDRRMHLSFIRHAEEFDSTAELVGRAEHVEAHPRNTGSLAQVALSTPLLVDTLPDEQIHPFDEKTKEKNNSVNQTALDIVRFLSFGTFKTKKKPVLFPGTRHPALTFDPL